MLPGEGLSTGSKRSIGRSMISSFIKAGFNRQQGLNMLKTQGLGYRRTTYLKDWSLISNIAQKVNPLKYVRKDLKPTSAVIVKTEDQQDNRYKFVYNVTLLFPDTNIVLETTTTLESMELHPLGVVDDMVEPRIALQDSKPGAVLLSYERESITECPNPRLWIRRP